MFVLVLAGLLVVGGFGLYDHKVIDVTETAPYVSFDVEQFNNGDNRFGEIVAPVEYDNDYKYLENRNDN